MTYSDFKQLPSICGMELVFCHVHNSKSKQVFVGQQRNHISIISFLKINSMAYYPVSDTCSDLCVPLLRSFFSL